MNRRVGGRYASRKATSSGTAADTHVRALLAEALFHAEHADRGIGEGVQHQHVLPRATDAPRPATNA